MEQENYSIEEISLRELIEIILRRKNMIAIITTISILLAGIVSFLVIDPTYESSMILMASNVSDKATSQSLDGNIDQMLDTISRYPSMNIETYRRQVTTPEVLAKTIKDLGLDEKYSVDTLSDKIKLETVKDTQLITIKMGHTDPELAATIVNKLGENFINFVTQNAKDKAKNTSDYLVSQMEIEKTKYDKALLEQKALLSQPRGADELNLELSAMLSQVTEYKIELNDLKIRKDALTASINTAGKIPGNGNTFTLNQETGKIIFDDSLRTLKIESADVEARITSVSNKIEELQDKIEGLQVEYQDKSHKQGIVEQKVELARATYESFVKKYEEIRVAESAQIGESSITIVSRAYPSTRPVAPRKALNVAVGAVLGMMIGVFAAFFIEYWKATDIKEEI